MHWKGTGYNWADWLTNSSQSANSLNSDPTMTDPGNDDFTIPLGSPCIDAGVTIDNNGRKDLLGRKVMNGKVDVGALEGD